MTTTSKTEQQEAQDQLREWIKPGDTLYTVLRHVSASGMTRWIDVYRMTDNDPHWLSSLVAKATNMTLDRKREAIKIGGAGMDMGFAIVYELSHALYGDGYRCIGVGGSGKRGYHCPSNTHVNPGKNRDKYGAGVTHRDGYALNHRWI